MTKRLAAGRKACKVIGATPLTMGAMITYKKEMKSKTNTAERFDETQNTGKEINIKQHVQRSCVCAKLAATALEESKRDWSNECKTFCCNYEQHIQEDWIEQAREFEANIQVDKRSEHR